MNGKKPSEWAEEVLEYLEECRMEYEKAYAVVGEEDKRLQDMLHALEFAPNKQERNKVATQFQRSRKTRRKAKDEVLALEKIYNFWKDPQNKPMLRRLKTLIPQQREREEYLEGDRYYIERMPTKGGGDCGL